MIYGAVCESVASELAARRTAMEGCDQQCRGNDREAESALQPARQASITQEITEIVGGAEGV